MLITKISPYTGISNTKDVPITEQALSLFNNGMRIEIACPGLSADDREFLTTGAIPSDLTAETKTITVPNVVRNRYRFKSGKPVQLTPSMGISTTTNN